VPSKQSALPSRVCPSRIQHSRSLSTYKLDALLRERLLPHEWRDDREIYTRIRQQGGGLDVMAGMSRTHMEIPRQIHNLTSLRKALPEAGPSDAQCGEVQRLLYGLEAITALHFAQEEEIYRALESD